MTLITKHDNGWLEVVKSDGAHGYVAPAWVEGIDVAQQSSDQQQQPPEQQQQRPESRHADQSWEQDAKVCAPSSPGMSTAASTVQDHGPDEAIRAAQARKTAPPPPPAHRPQQAQADKPPLLRKATDWSIANPDQAEVTTQDNAGEADAAERPLVLVAARKAKPAPPVRKSSIIQHTEGSAQQQMQQPGGAASRAPSHSAEVPTTGDDGDDGEDDDGDDGDDDSDARARAPPPPRPAIRPKRMAIRKHARSRSEGVPGVHEHEPRLVLPSAQGDSGSDDGEDLYDNVHDGEQQDHVDTAAALVQPHTRPRPGRMTGSKSAGAVSPKSPTPHEHGPLPFSPTTTSPTGKPAVAAEGEGRRAPAPRPRPKPRPRPLSSRQGSLVVDANDSDHQPVGFRRCMLAVSIAFVPCVCNGCVG